MDAAQGILPASVSVVIVNFNGGGLLSNSVRAVLSSAASADVCVVDNGSTDQSIADLQRRVGLHPRLRIIENGVNLGFTRASNIALREARGEYLLLLNPDCVVGQTAIERMLAVMQDHRDVGMAGCLVRNPDGSEQAGCRRAVPTPWRTFVRVLHLNKIIHRHPRFRTYLLNQDPLPTKPIDVEAISGAFMLVRRSAMEEVGLLDEGYFLHCDDLDWCMRFRQKGWRILFVSDVEVIHYKGTCSIDRPVRVLYHMHRGMVRFYRKFFRHQYPLPLMLAVMSAVWLRFGVLATREVLRGVLAGRPTRTRVAEAEGSIVQISVPSRPRQGSPGHSIDGVIPKKKSKKDSAFARMN